MARLQSINSEKTIRKIDIAQVSLSLQDRLGLAKVKYQNGRIPALESNQSGGRRFPLANDKPSDSSSEISHSRCETPMTSPPLRTATYSKELPRSSRNRHAATFNSRVMQPMLSASRKRIRSDSISDRPSKAPRVSWKSSYRLPASSPGFHHHAAHRHQPLPFVAETIPEFSSPAYYPHSDEENDPDLPVHSFQHVSSMVGSSPPRTPPPKHARLARKDPNLLHEDGADLLLYLANSPTPASIAGKAQARDFPPSTPPSQHAVLPTLTPTPGGGGVFPNLGTPSQQFNFADFVNVTPSPAQPARGGRTPGGPMKTPLANRDGRRRPNFDNLLPPSAESPKNRPKESGLALQLGGELRP
ncbi:hypothetical protein IFM61606_05127 [Aspergillus udagawae]|uniref:Uncharacterized protein n=1 Tax=Aspergillus udagawae TaxID=91492 RepID=A0ABQ1B2F0_9EURO|nr:hypothetical protein IFM51744_06878 [Aspergillus udagawae]GFF92496.1 hypothetical protein IFM53868_06863 [Aspergillus udagawae]GFG08354.1 hypothetical protein IFM5058_03884 [Aspergillus udagawae]GFG25193.1 hypothetical protein IFM61606_05127 [Aspergillus udagawae]